MFDEGPAQSVSGTTTQTAVAVTGTLLSAGICAGADAATITVRSGGASGTVLCKLGVAAGLSAERVFLKGVPFSDLHITITGTTPQWDVEFYP